MPPFYGLALDDESVDRSIRFLSDYEAFIKSICE